MKGFLGYTDEDLVSTDFKTWFPLPPSLPLPLSLSLSLSRSLSLSLSLSLLQAKKYFITRARVCAWRCTSGLSAVCTNLGLTAIYLFFHTSKYACVCVKFSPVTQTDCTHINHIACGYFLGRCEGIPSSIRPRILVA
jgi:hypothetical protein